MSTTLRDQSPARPTAAPLADRLRQATEAVTALGSCAADLEGLSDTALLAAQARIGRARQLLDTYAAWTAAALADRSRPELGQSGLALKHGFLTPEAMIQKITGTTRGDAVTLIVVGTLLAQTEAAERAVERAVERAAETAWKQPDGTADDPADDPAGDPAEDAGLVAVAVPWQAPIARAVTTGSLSVDAADAIRKGLGDVDTAVTGTVLAAALTRLLAEAPALNADQLYKRSRQLRDTLDEAGIAAREQQAHDARYLRVWRLGTGQVRVNGLFAPEDGEHLLSAVDSAIAPRRGVKFVDKQRAAWAKRIMDDPRTTDQLAADTLIVLLKIAGDADPGQVYGGRRPAVRVLVTTRTHSTDTTGAPGTPGTAGTADGTDSDSDSEDGDGSTDTPRTAGAGQAPGHGTLEGNPAPVSTETVDRYLCETGYLAIQFDNTGQPVNIGREQRLFTPAQRTALAARDGGCRWPDCDKPPSHTQAHHIQHWLRDNGHTDIADGILLCGPHHRLLHNQHWEITRDNTGYWLTPPPNIDPHQHRIPLPATAPLPVHPPARP